MPSFISIGLKHNLDDQVVENEGSLTRLNDALPFKILQKEIKGDTAYLKFPLLGPLREGERERERDQRGYCLPQVSSPRSASHTFSSHRKCSLISFRKSAPPQNRRLNIFVCPNKQLVDDFVGELTF